MTVDIDKVKPLIRQLLIELGEDPDREGLQETPKRVAKYWKEFIDYDAGKTDTTFTQTQVDQMVLVKGMRVWSLCEHHLLPFWADIAIAYIPEGKVIGLSKLARIAHKHAHKLQLQEQLVDQISSEVKTLLNTQNVAVIASGVHTCMVMRGIKTDGTMVTSQLSGIFRTSNSARAEFLSLVKD